MKVHGNLDFGGKGKLIRAGLQDSDFPTNPSEGELLFKDKRVYICVKVLGGLPFWVPLTQEINTVRYDQTTPALEWTIDHNMGVNLGFIQIYDTNGFQILPSDIDASRENRAIISFAVPTAGTALFMYGAELMGNEHQSAAYTNTYTNQAVWVVNHGLGFNPAITVIVDNYVVQPESIVHNSLMQSTVTFSSPQSGSVRCV